MAIKQPVPLLLPVGPISGADASLNCLGTNIMADYGPNADVFIRSPQIDLTDPSLTGAELRFQQWVDLEYIDPIAFAEGFIRVLRASDDSQLGAVVAIINGAAGPSLDWSVFSANLPPEALGEMIKLEFQFISDFVNLGGPWDGWYIDDLSVTAP